MDVKTIMYEHGGIGQTVKHAHIHIMPREELSLARVLKSMRIPGSLKRLKSVHDVAKYRNYFLFISEGTPFIFLPECLDVDPGIITNTVAKILGKPYPCRPRISRCPSALTPKQ
jgi:hypothetical protein